MTLPPDTELTFVLDPETGEWSTWIDGQEYFAKVDDLADLKQFLLRRRSDGEVVESTLGGPAYMSF